MPFKRNNRETLVGFRREDSNKRVPNFDIRIRAKVINVVHSSSSLIRFVKGKRLAPTPMEPTTSWETAIERKHLQRLVQNVKEAAGNGNHVLVAEHYAGASRPAALRLDLFLHRRKQTTSAKLTPVTGYAPATISTYIPPYSIMLTYSSASSGSSDELEEEEPLELDASNSSSSSRAAGF